MENKKQFLLLVDEIGMAILGQMIPSLKFLEIQGMSITEDPLHKVLVHPVAEGEAPKIEQAV